MKKILVALLSIAALMSCGRNSGSHMPNITGRSGEVLVVFEESLRKDTAGKYLMSVLTQPYLGLPQTEEFFTLLTTPPHYFEKQIRYFRNIVIAETGDKVEKDTIQFFSSQWAQGQAIVRISAKQPQELIPMIHRNEVKIISYFNKAERDRIIAYNRSVNYTLMTNEIEKQWGIHLLMPTGYNKNKSNENFTWLSQETPESSQGLMIYGMQWEDKTQFTKEFMIKNRDIILHKNVEGPATGTYMTTEKEADLYFKIEETDKMEIAELRGLWKTAGYAMGGPFLMRAYRDKETNKVVVTDGYVYYPSKQQKRNMMRQLEAVMYSVRFSNN